MTISIKEVVKQGNDMNQRTKIELLKSQHQDLDN